MKFIITLILIIPSISIADGSFKLKKYDTDSSPSKSYESTFGNKYQYDLSNPVDRLKYDVDLKAQLRDEMDVNPIRELDRDLGQYGGGIYRR